MNKYCFIIFLLISSCCFAQSEIFEISKGGNIASIVYSRNGPALDSIIAVLLAEDIERVTSLKPKLLTDLSSARGNTIIIGGVSSSLIRQIAKTSLDKLQGRWECYGLSVIKNVNKNIPKALVISGSDARGTAYGVFSISEKMGISPWYWWADVNPKKQRDLVITQKTFISSPPSVKYRGIFINDEDWGLQPWAAKTFEPETNDIGPKTYARVFELLLRLKANLIWPAMHPSTKAFYHYPGNVKAAEDYQVIIGSSHAEPMLRNNVSEWDEKTMGRFNYITNKPSVTKYWEDRIKESKGVNAIYSMGMRGVHDGQMEGIKNLDEAVPLTETIIRDERDLLAKYLNPDVTKIPQVLTPYKEVLDIYDKGLKVPDDITLVWPDDNYGYINRLNNEEEKKRKGSSGIYYHVSYWGRPHDYLWLPSTNPALMREELMKAYATGADRLWVVNVGDIKPIEYNIQLFLDMAYDAPSFGKSNATKAHLLNWSAHNFGKSGAEISSILSKYYQLAYERRPEFMGWSQTEPSTNTRRTEFNHFYFGDEAQKRIDAYDFLETSVKKLRSIVDPKDADAFYQLVYYPVVCASWMNKKFLYADKFYFYAAQNRLSAYEYAQLSGSVYDSIVNETKYYNEQLASAKWKNMMSMKPRDLSVYKAPVFPDIKMDGSNAWGIAPEGFVTKDSGLIKSTKQFTLPAFDNLNRQRYFIDIFLSRSQKLKWVSTVSEAWIHVSKNSGELIAENGKRETRIWVEIDWKKMTPENKEPVIRFSAEGQIFEVSVPVIWRQPLTFRGFVENNGYVSMEASHATRLIDKSSRGWQVIDGPGYSAQSLQALPITAKSNMSSLSVAKAGPSAEYDFYTYTAAAPIVKIFAVPTHPVNNTMGVRLALSIDDGPAFPADFKTFGRSEEWKQNVLSNRAGKSIKLPTLQPGKHTLKVFLLDTGLILDEIRIDLGGLPRSYGNIPETSTPY